MKRIKIATKAIISCVGLSMRRIINRGICFDGIIIRDKTAKINVSKNAKISLGNKCRLDRNCELKSNNVIKLASSVEIGDGTAIISTKTGTIEMGDNVFINRNCTVVSCEKILIGSGTAIGYNTVILDHDHYFVKEGAQPWNEIKSLPVIIGRNVWIGANVTILAGTNIGDNSVIAAGSVVKGNVPKSTLFIQKRNTYLKDIE